MSELRWHPLLREWVSVAAARQNRPQMPKDHCPFCAADKSGAWIYPNDFPAFSADAPPFVDSPELFAKTGNRGSCDVVVYDSRHDLLPSAMTVEQWADVVNLWRSQTRTLFENPDIAFVQIFENAGEAIGVTMPHPHGQIYSLPFVPPLMQREIDSAQSHFESESECLYCRILVEELRVRERLVVETEFFAAFVPFHARFPGEVQIYCRRHVGDLIPLSSDELADLARIIRAVRRKYDGLWGFPIPLMMLVRQRPSRGEHPYFHFHIEFLPIQRSPEKLKYLAAVESGTGLFLNDTVPEEKAGELRNTAPFDR